LGKIKILYPQKHSIFYGYGQVYRQTFHDACLDGTPKQFAVI